MWTFTLTDDNGDTATVTYTEDGTPTVAEVATGLYNAWIASTHPLVNRLSAANPSDGVVKLTSKTAGVPFSVSLADSGTGTDTAVDTVANIGNNDAALDRNWSQNDAPDTGDDLIFEAGGVHLKYGLDFSGVSIGDFKVLEGCQSEFGRFDLGQFHYFQIAPTSFDYRGSAGLACFDIGSANIPVYIASYGSPSAIGRHAVYITGSDITTLEVVKGNVGLGVLDADAATAATILCGSLENTQSDVNLTIGENTTVTTVTQSGGNCKLRCAATTVNVFPSCTMVTEGTGAITTVNVYKGAKFVSNSSGTITTLNVWGEVDFTKDNTARTVTNLNLEDGGKLLITDNITVTNPTYPAGTGGGVYEVTAKSLQS